MSTWSEELLAVALLRRLACRSWGLAPACVGAPGETRTCCCAWRYFEDRNVDAKICSNTERQATYNDDRRPPMKLFLDRRSHGPFRLLYRAKARLPSLQPCRQLLAASLSPLLPRYL